MRRSSIHFVSGKCGAGKSHEACSDIKDGLCEKNFLYVAPSLQLVSEIEGRLRAMGVALRVITSETHPNSVKRAAMEALEWAPDLGCCLLLTWQAFSELPFFPNRDEWQVIVDEIPQLDRPNKLKVPFNQGFITKHVEIDYAVNEKVALLRAVDEGKLKSFLNKPRDDVHRLFPPRNPKHVRRRTAQHGTLRSDRVAQEVARPGRSIGKRGKTRSWY